MKTQRIYLTRTLYDLEKSWLEDSLSELASWTQSIVFNPKSIIFIDVYGDDEDHAIVGLYFGDIITGKNE